VFLLIKRILMSFFNQPKSKVEKSDIIEAEFREID